MFKKLTAIMMTVGLAIAFVPQVQAAQPKKVESAFSIEQSTGNPKADKIISETNEKINDRIEKAQQRAEDVKSEKELDKIIIKLQEDCKAMTERGIRKLSKLGIKAECEYIEVTIGWKTVLVDPIKVVE